MPVLCQSKGTLRWLNHQQPLVSCCLTSVSNRRRNFRMSWRETWPHTRTLLPRRVKSGADRANFFSNIYLEIPSNLPFCKLWQVKLKVLLQSGPGSSRVLDLFFLSCTCTLSRALDFFPLGWEAADKTVGCGPDAQRESFFQSHEWSHSQTHGVSNKPRHYNTHQSESASLSAPAKRKNLNALKCAEGISCSSSITALDHFKGLWAQVSPMGKCEF